MKSKKSLFIVATGNKKTAKTSWEKGSSFPALNIEGIYLSKNNVDFFRNSYDRIILQYDSGTVEV